MREKISTYAPGVNEVFAAVDVELKEKVVEIENKLFSSKAALSGLKDHTANVANEEVFACDQDGREA